MTDKELLQQALFWIKGVTLPATNELAEKISARLAQPEQEPVATVYDAYDTTGIDWHCKDAPATGTKLYTAPPQTKTKQEPVTYTGNGTAGREADVKPTGFFFQMPKPVGKVYGWHGTGKGQPMCNFDTTEASMPVGTMLYTAPPHREWQGLTDEQVKQIEMSASSTLSAIYLTEAQLKGKNT